MHSWQFIYDQLRQGNSCVLLLVVQSEGSSPGRQGFKMAVALPQAMSGSIGGGIMEHKLVLLALDMLQRESVDIVLKKQIHNKQSEVHQSGMICSGEQTVVLLPIHKKQLATVEKILNPELGHTPSNIILSKDGLQLGGELLSSSKYYYRPASGSEGWLYQEQLTAPRVMHIIGGGHVSLALSRQMDLLGFEVRVYDNRAALNTMADNLVARQKQVIEYASIANYIPEGAQHYVVIMTFGYRDDKIVLRELLDKEFGYIGMMGSEAKVKQLLEELEAEGTGAERLAHIHSPIGLSIGSKTPAEIAVSIAAEIIAGE